MRLERPKFRLETERLQRALHVVREQFERGMPLDAEPDHARPRQRGERAHAAQPHLERPRGAHRRLERRPDGLGALVRNVAEELERDVERRGRHPLHRQLARAERRRGVVGRTPFGLGQIDGDEESHSGGLPFRAPS
jgi:hypothetical protein